MKNTLMLPSFLYPLYETDLIRIGKDNDGGYLIPKQSLNSTQILYSFGMSDDWSFEEDFQNKTGAKVICYDPTVDWKLFLKKRSFKALIKYFQYRNFFDGKNRIHEKKMITPKGTYRKSETEESIEDLNTMLTESSSNYFFKIDIEGSEYRILDQLIKHASSMTGLAMELHNCDLHIDRIKNFIENFDLQLVHIHVNNYCRISPKKIPYTIEVIFSPKKFNKKITSDLKKFPTSLDQPNNNLFEDYIVEFDNKKI